MLRTPFSYFQACKLVCILLLAGIHSAAAQDLIFENSLEQAVTITNFSVSVPSIAAGESTTLSWTTDSAANCTPSNGAGGWNSVSLDVPDGTAQVEILLAGTHPFTLTCEGVVGSPAVADVDVTVSSNAVIISFGVSPDLILEGNDTTVSWTTANAESCTTSGGTPGWDALTPVFPDGNTQIVNAAAGSYTFTLTCQGAVGDPVSADATLTVSQPVSITDFSASPNSILVGGSATLRWAIENATSCTPSGGAGGWDAVSITLPDGNTSISIPDVGDYVFVLICEGASGSQAVADVAVTVSLPATVSLLSTLELVPEGESTTISWDTENAMSCTPSGGASDWDTLDIALPTGSADIVIPTAEPYTFTLTCEGAAGDAAVGTALVTGESNGCSAPSLPGYARRWKEDFWLEDFPYPGYDNRKAFMGIKDYFALEFNTGNIVDDGKILTVETTYTDGVRLGAFSECPGDFDVAEECRQIWGLTGSMRWATNGYPGACQLKPNTTYYFNVTFTDGISGSTSTCYKTPCVTTIQVSNR